jgi:hypothetical protein
VKKLSDLKINKRNPRQINEPQLKKLCESIKRDPQFMALRPIVVDETGVILGGNQRYKACLELGMVEVPDEWVVCAKDLTPEQQKRFIVVDNAPPGMAGDWDMDELEMSFSDIDLPGLGFDFGGDAEESLLEEEEIVPYRRCHILLSVTIDKAADLIEAAQALADEYDAEVYASQN